MRGGGVGSEGGSRGGGGAVRAVGVVWAEGGLGMHWRPVTTFISSEWRQYGPCGVGV